MDLVTLAQAASEAVPEGGGKWMLLWALVGAGVLRLLQWLADFMTQGGQKKLLDLLAEALKKSNNTSVGGQIKADDVLVKILEDAIPVVMGTLSDAIKKDIADGKLNDKETWARIHKITWEKVKPQVVGGANDYLKNSSWDDGLVVAKLVWDKWAAKKKEEKTA